MTADQPVSQPVTVPTAEDIAHMAWVGDTWTAPDGRTLLQYLGDHLGPDAARDRMTAAQHILEGRQS